MYKKDKANLMAIQDSCTKIIDFTKGVFFFRFEIAVSHVEWDKIRSFRNIVAHNYFGVDADEVWQIIDFDIPQLQKFI